MIYLDSDFIVSPKGIKYLPLLAEPLLRGFYE